MLELDRLIRQQNYLLNISRTLTGELNLNEVLRQILLAATEILLGEAGMIALAEEDGSFRVRASHGIPRRLLHLFSPLLSDIPRGDPDSFRIPELDRKMNLVARAAGMGLHQVIALPMAVGKELVGVVYIFRAQGHSFTRSEINLLQNFANQAAIAVHNARLYEQVTREKQRFNAILRHSGDGVMILTAEQKIESINLVLSRMTGWDEADAPGRYHDEIIRWARREPGLDLGGAFAGGWPLNEHSLLYVEGDLLRRDGSTISVGMTYAPLFSEAGHLRNIIVDVRDITKFREAEEAKSTFVSVISHELKTPVSLIKGYASTLLREDARWDERTVQNGLQVIEEEADRLSELIENLLDVTRLQAGMLTLRHGPVRLDKLAERIIEKFSTQVGPQYTLKTDFPADFPGIQADEQRLRQVLANLIGNAIKYSPKGGDIIVGGEALETGVRVWISDMGIGMTAEQQENIFERFYRVDNALTRETQGVGLGLYIVRSLVKAHRGTVEVSSVPGRGTIFSVTLPFSQE